MKGVILVRFRSCDGLHFDDLVSTKVQHDYLGAFPRNEEKQIPFGFSFLNQWYQIHCEQQNRSESDIALNFDNYERMCDVVWIHKQESISAGWGEEFPLWLHPSWPSWTYQGVGLRGSLDGKGRGGSQIWGQGDIYMPCDWPMASWVVVTWEHLLVKRMTETDMTENITFQRSCWRAVMIHASRKRLLSQLVPKTIFFFMMHLDKLLGSIQVPCDVISPTQMLNTLHIHLCSSDTQTIWPMQRLHRDITVVIESDER